MQSQQKRLKWSRGETAEALEERTDTGITQASVEFLENCVPDVYGNISRRPGLKILELGDSFASTDNMGFSIDIINIVPFYFSENDFILIGLSAANYPEFLRIKNLKVVGKKKVIYNGLYGNINGVSIAQQNNFLTIASNNGCFKVTFTDVNGSDFNVQISRFEYSAGWYAPYGTVTKTIDTNQVSGLNFHGGFTQYVYTDNISSTVYSQIDTGLTNNSTTISGKIPAGSIVQFPNIGCYFRVEGYYVGNNTHVIMFGELLTPVADDSASDSTVSIETNYVSLQPDFSVTYLPAPTKLCFHEQRLWAGGWKLNLTSNDQYSLVVGSQIARYNDFKNNYNQDNEPITLDILTKYKEKITHLIEYNGLKIFTDSNEYAYQNGGVARQSSNGSLATCEPIVFESLCLYCDKTGSQIRAMQYQFQNNIYDSNIINQMAPHDLIWNPTSLAAYEDKINSTGKYLFVLNSDATSSTTTANPRIAVCNFVPANQANIWSRWNFPRLQYYFQRSSVHFLVNINKLPIFMIGIDTVVEQGGEISSGSQILVPAILDFNAISDYDINLTNNQVLYSTCLTGSTTYKGVLRNVNIDIFSNGVYQFSSYVDYRGYITEDLSGLENVTVGFRINSTIRSHPIDVGGKTKSEKKRIGKAQMSVHDTEPGAITLNGKTGYMNPEHDHICFYGVSGMKDEVKYVITNNNGAMFHLESLLMNIEYGTLDS